MMGIRANERTRGEAGPAGLDRCERAVIRALRGWRACERPGGLAMARLAVADAGLPDDLVLPLAAALGVLGAFARADRPCTGASASSAPSSDERALLEALAALQRGDEVEADRHLRAWAQSPLSRGMIRVGLRDLADSLSRCGACLPGAVAVPERLALAAE
jgi:hypothetical protein